MHSRVPTTKLRAQSVCVRAFEPHGSFVPLPRKLHHPDDSTDAPAVDVAALLAGRPVEGHRAKVRL
jgi:hypothetical protein